MRRPARFVAAVAAMLVAVVALPGARAAERSPSSATGAGTTRRLGATTDLVAAAVDISRGTWAEGAATRVVLARSDTFADSLAGAVVAGADGPLLFVPPTASTLPPEVAAEAARVLGRGESCPGPKEVVLLGGAEAMSAAPRIQARLLGPCVREIAGDDRIATAIAAADHVVDEGGDPSTVLLARADEWSDAVAASAYAARDRHPILVTGGDALDPRVDAALTRLAPRRIVLLGGADALSADVEAAAATHAAVERIAGASRAETAVQVAERLAASGDLRGVLLVNGFAPDSWGHALAGAVTAAREGASLLFVDGESMSEAVSDHLDLVGDDFSIVVGPDERVGPALVASVEASRGAIEPPGDGLRRYRDEVFDAVERTNVAYTNAVDHRGIRLPLRADIYTPADDTTTARPLIVFVHGGGFYRGGTGTREKPTYLPLVRRGYVVASIEYRIIPPPGCVDGPADTCEAGMRDAVDDAQAAIAYLRTNASEYGIDPTRVAIVGSSAGGVTALHVAYASEEEPDVAVRAAVSYSGANVIGEITAGDAPALLLHGGDDDVVDYELARQTADDAREAGLFALLRTFPVGHDLSPYRSELIEQTVRFLWWQLDVEAAAR